ncbi:MAG: phosphoadenylyl-sulfate reductase [Candidatus Dadabacteria bacterium]|nr:MAG: phosphoadenylyl-sulfate reductase [Candidatus Dadabacteria bacterium]
MTTPTPATTAAQAIPADEGAERSAALQELANRLSAIDDPWEKLRVAASATAPGRISLGTSGQLTGTAIIEGAHQHNIPLRVFTIDTLRLFPETVEYFDTLESHYGISIERVHPDDQELDRMIRQHGVFLFFDSKAKQEYCCEIRKVRPNFRALRDVDVWVTGLRRDQSAFRADTPAVQVTQIPNLDSSSDEKHTLIKLAPLIDWDEARVRAFLKEARAPLHPLLEESEGEWFFESLGCVICTTRQARWEPPRAGRWRWFNESDAEKKECGIHLPPPSHIND